MSAFTDAEISYLQEQGLVRIAVSWGLEQSVGGEAFRVNGRSVG